MLSEFDFELDDHPGKKHGNVDAMPICPNPRNCPCPIAEEHKFPCKSCKKCLRKVEIMLGTLPGQVSQPLDVTGRTEDSANVQSGWGHYNIIPCSWKLPEEVRCV